MVELGIVMQTMGVSPKLEESKNTSSDTAFVGLKGEAGVRVMVENGNHCKSSSRMG
jgi:hypothetical protein